METIATKRSKASLVTHPIRARLILVLMGRHLTTQEMAELLPDIPKTSLYRHVRELAEADVFKVVGEKAIRGTIEKTYQVQRSAVSFSKEDLLDAGHEEYLQLVNGVLGGVSEVFQSYLAREEKSLPEDTLFRINAAHLTDEEFWELRKKLTELLDAARDKPPTAERRRRVIGLFGVPDESAVENTK